MSRRWPACCVRPSPCRRLRAGVSQPGRLRSGAALVEMALISPVLLLVGLLVIVGAQLFSAEIGLANAARAGANAAAVAVSNGEAQGSDCTGSPSTYAYAAACLAAQNEEGGSLSCSSTYCVSLASMSGVASNITIYTVTVDETVHPFIPLIPSIDISAQAGATCLGQQCP